MQSRKSRTRFHHLWVLFVVGLTSGCAQKNASPEMAPAVDPSGAWQRALTSAVSEKGVDYNLLDENRATLNRFLGWVGEHGPLTGGWRESAEDKRIAFLANAFNAAAIDGYLRHRPAHSVQDVQIGLFTWKGAGFYRGQRYHVDGEWMTLGHLERVEIVARYQEPLAWIALHHPTKGSPKLHWWPNTRLQSKLKGAMRHFVNSDQGMRRHGDGWTVSARFFDYAGELVDWTEADNLCEWMLGYADDERAVWLESQVADCNLQSFPFDWTLDRVAL